jgi:hypothetical protein
MPWHLSKSNPCKIYDERHEVAALATSPEHAARIVAAVTGKSQDVGRQPDEPDETENQPSLTHSFDHDECCGPRIQKASRAGVLASLTSWTCPKCDTEWKPKSAGLFTHWSPAVFAQVLR